MLRTARVVLILCLCTALGLAVLHAVPPDARERIAWGVLYALMIFIPLRTVHLLYRHLRDQKTPPVRLRGLLRHAPVILVLVLVASCGGDHEWAGDDGSQLPPLVTIYPPRPTTEDDLEVVIVEARKDVQYTYRWNRNGEPYDSDGDGNFTTLSNSLDHRHTTKGEVWTVYAWVAPPAAASRFSTAQSAPSGAAEGSASVTIVNSPRQCSAAAVVQDYFGDQLFFDCTCVNGSDPDGEDDISDRCQFRINEISTQASPTTDGCHIPADQVLRNSNLACTLVPADTDSEGDPIDSPTVAVTNRMPGPPVVSLSPPSGSVADTFTCQILQPSVDPDGDAVVYSYRWWVGGFSDPRFSESSVVAGLLASDLNDTPVAAGDTIACEAIPNDPYGPGQSALSTTVTLGEAACVTAADCFFGHPCLIGSCNGGTCSYQGPAAGCPGLADVFGSAFRSMRLDAPLLGDSFDVTGQGVLELGPFGPVAVAGNVTKQAGGPITWCFDSKTTVDVQLALLKFENAKVTMCRDEQGAYEGTFAGDMILETSRIPVTGTFSAGASWEFGVTATDVDFLGIPFQSLSFSAGETDRQLTITGQFALGDATHGPQLAITGNFTPGQNLRLDVGLAPGFTWYPLPSYPQLSFADIDGELTRVAGVVELHVKREWAGTLDLADGFSGTGLWAEGRLSSTEPWTVSLGATTMVAPLTDPVTISGDFVEDSQFPGTGLLCLSGDGSVPTTPSTPLTATVCLHLGGPDDPTAESVSFSTDLTAPLPQPDGGKYTLNGRYDDRTDLLTLTSDMGWQPTAEFISTLKVGVTIDFTSDPPTLSEVGYSAQIDIAPFPPQVLTGSYDADKEQLCLFDTIQSVPGLDTSLTVEACLNTPDSGPVVLDSITFGSMVNIPLVGPTSLGGSYAVGKLCLGPATNFNGFASWSLPGFADDSLAVQVCYNENTKAFDAVVFNGTFGTDFMKEPIPVTGGALEKNSAIWICLSGLPTFADSAGAFAGSINNVTVCLAENDGSVTVAEVSFGGAISTPQVGNLTLSGDYANDELCLTSNVDTNAHNWFAGFESLTTVDRFYVRSCLDVVSKTFEDLATVIVFTVGADPTAADAVTVQAQAATDFSGDITLTVSQVPAGSCPADRVCAQNWRPFSAIGGSFANLEFSNFGGSIVRTAAGTTTVDVHGELSAGGEGSSLTIFPGFTLDDVQAEAFFGSGDVGIKLRGSYGFDVGEEHLNVIVRAEVAESGVMSFSGSVAPEDPEHGFQPLKSLVGEDNFSLGTIDVTLAANLDQETVALTFTSQNPFVRVVLPTCSPEVSRSCPELKLASLDGGVADLNGEPGAYFIMTLDAIDIPLVPPSESKPGLTLALGNMPGEVVAIGLSSLSGLTVPAWPGKDPLSQGISFFAKGECPFALGSDGSKPSGSFGVDVDVQSKQLKVDAEIDFDWEIIRPEYNMPGVSSLATTSLNFIATISDVSQFAFGGKVSLVPDNPFDPALSNASLSGDLFLLVDTEGNFGGEIGLEGLWKEPFFMPDFAVMNPALQLKLHLTPAAGVPVPSGVGINGDFFWLKPANSWPNVCEGDQPGDGSCISTTVPNANVPEQLLHAGGTFYFDSAVIPSGFLSVPMPQFIVRLDVDGFDGVGDFVGIANSVKHGVRNYLDWTAEHIPDTGPIPEILPAADIAQPTGLDFDLTVHNLDLYFSTHNLNLFGVDFTAGLLTDLDATMHSKVPGITSERVFWRGAMDPNGISLQAQLQAFELSDAFVISGDPLKKDFRLAASDAIEVATDNRLDLPTGTIEGWVAQDAWDSSANFDHTLIRHTASSFDGYRVDLGDAETVCEFAAGNNCENFGSATYPCYADRDTIRAGNVGDGTLSQVAQDFIACGKNCPTPDASCLEQCAADYPDTLEKLSPGCAACYESALSCEQRARVRVQVGDPSGLRTVTTRDGVVPPATQSAPEGAHLAVTLGSDDRIHVYVNGRTVATDDDNAPIDCTAVCTATDCSKACAGGPCSAEECLGRQRPEYDPAACSDCQQRAKLYHPIMPAPAAAAVYIGENLERIDDVRLWNSVRSAAQIRSTARRLPLGYFGDQTLIARYEADFDGLSADDLKTVHNSRLYDLSLPPLHGAFVSGNPSGAEIYHDLANNDVLFQLDLPAGIGVVNSDFKLRAGVALNVQMLGVNQTALGEVSLGQGKAQGEFYVVENAGGLPIFDLGSLGTLILGGDGPNARRGDFDDGLYGEIDLPSGGVNASATLVWRDGSGKDLLIGDAQFENLCTQETCNNMAEYTTNIGGTIDDLPLPLLGGSSIQDASVDFRSDNKVCICHDQDSSNDCTLDGGGSGCNTGNNIGYPDDGSCPPAQLECINTDVRFEATSGKITVGGTSYPTSTDLTITKEQLAWDSTLDLLDLGDLVTALSIKWADVPDRFCGHAQYDFPGGDGWPAFTTSFDGCAGDADIVHALEAGMKSGGFCVNDDFCATTQTCSLGLCVDQFADGSPCLRPRNCKNGGCDGFCYTPHTKGIGEACLNDDECASDACFGVCSCSTDPDTCPAGERCVGTGSAALCVPKAHGLVCGSVSECPNTTDYLCYVGDFGDTQCLWHHDSSWNTLLAGEACYADRECASNNCVGKTAETPGLCNCTSAGGCPAGRACIGVVGQVATCLPTTEGTKCNNNQDCSGGRACVANPEAGGAKQCLTQGVSRKAGQACVTDSQCVSKQCVGTKYVGVQQAPGLCDCDGNAACSTGWCFVAASGIPGVCFPSHCDSDADCPSSDYCFAGGCYKKAGSGAICTSNHVCRSDHCDADCVTILGKKICGYTCK
jgi:hypothetical protein